MGSEEMARNDQQVAGDDGTPNVAVERGLRSPIASIQAEDPFEKRNDPFDAGSEVSQSLEDPTALGHFRDLQSASFGKDDILHTEFFDVVEIAPGRKPSVECDLAWCATMALDMPLDHGHGQGGISWVALEDLTVEHQRGGAGRKADLVTVECVAPIFADDVGMVLEDGNDLVFGRDRLSTEDAPSRLVDDLMTQLEIPVELLSEPFCLEIRQPCQHLASGLGTRAYVLGNADQVPIGADSLALGAGTVDLSPPLLGTAPTIVEDDDLRPE